MIWLLLSVMGSLIAISLFFERKRKKRHPGLSNEEDSRNMREIFQSKGAGQKAADPKNSKIF